MKHLFYLMVGCCILLSSCAPEPIEEKLVSNQVNRDIPQGTRSLAEAISIAEDFFSQTSNKTRSYPRVIESVESVSSTQTRSGEEAPALYLINYADNSGFALIGANKEAYDIYAISDEGNLAMTDTIGNAPLADFVGKAIYHAEAMANAPANTPALPDPVIVVDFRYYIKTYVDPMLQEGASKWHQKSPFNKYCYQNNPNFKMPVGCGPISLCQLMSYYDEFISQKYVVTYNGLKLDWSDFAIMGFDEDGNPYNDDDFDNLAKSLHLVGTLLNCKYEYAPNGQTYSDSKDFLGALTKIGYENSELFLDQPLSENLNNVKTFLKSGKDGFIPAPLIFYGVSSKGKKEGHFWVVDGFVERYHKNTAPLPMYVDDPILFHCVWGQQSNSGFKNGYYAYLTASDMITAQEYYPEGGKGIILPNPYYEILVIGGYKRKNMNYKTE